MMDWLRQMWFRWRALFRRKDLEAEMAEEMRAHMEFEVEARRAQGAGGEEAQQVARRSFGGAEQAKERCRDEFRFVWLEQLGQDVRYAIRALVKAPSFTITAVVTLALGIGVNAALFSVVNMVMLRSLPVKDPDDLVTMEGRDARGSFQSGFSYAEYQHYRDSNRTLESVLAFSPAKWPIEGESVAQPDPARDGRGVGMVSVQLVSENYFGVLGGSIQLGRGFRPEEAKLGAAPVIVLSNLFWETRMRRSPEVVGSTLMLNRRAVTVIGIAGPEFSGHDAVPPAGWLPYSSFSNRPADYEPRGPQAFGLIGRLKPGISEEQAKADLDTIAAGWSAEFPDEHAKLSLRLQRGLRFLNLNLSAKGTKFLGLVIFGFGLVLVIACTNVANLLLARGVARQSEIGVRLTLGAGRGRIVRQLLTENVLLCGCGAALGLGLAIWTLQLLTPVIVSRLPTDWALETRHVPFLRATPDLHVLGFTALLTLGATLTAGLLPAWHASGADLVATVRSAGFGRRLSTSGLRKLLVIVQVAVSLTLLSCAGVLTRNLFVRQITEIGYDAQAVFGAILTPTAATADQNAAFRQALETVQAIPGVAASGVASPAPIQGVMATRIRRAGSTAGENESRVLASFVSDGFFDAFKIPLLRGRTFRELELNSAARVVIVSETLARELWPGQTAVGQRLDVTEERWSTRERPAPPEAFRECEVIGVVRDIMMEPTHDDRHVVYLPATLDTRMRWPVFIRPRQVSTAALAEIVRAAKAGGVELQFERRHSFWVEFFLLPFYALAVTSGALGALALGMASVGLHGLMTFSVNQRVREIGIRMALGATAKTVVGLFVRQGMRLVVVGLMLGLVGGALFALALGKIMYGIIDTFDPAAFAAVTVLFAVIAMFACWLPARRATKVDPMIALRAE